MILLQALAVLSLLLPVGLMVTAAVWFWRQWRASRRKVRRTGRIA